MKDALLFILFGIAVLALIVFLVRRNMIDQKNFEEGINNDYKKTRDNEGDIEIEELPR